MRWTALPLALAAVVSFGCVEFRKPAGTFAQAIDPTLAWKGDAPRARADGDLMIKFPAWDFPTTEEKEAFGDAVYALRDYGRCARSALRNGRITAAEYFDMNVVTDFYVAVLHDYLEGSKGHSFGDVSLAAYTSSASRLGVTSNLGLMVENRDITVLQQIRSDVQRFNDRCK